MIAKVGAAAGTANSRALGVQVPSSLIADEVIGGVAGMVGIESGVVSGVFNLESSGVEVPDWRPRHGLALGAVFIAMLLINALAF
jgi:hypothetical protein